MQHLFKFRVSKVPRSLFGFLNFFSSVIREWKRSFGVQNLKPGWVYYHDTNLFYLSSTLFVTLWAEDAKFTKLFGIYIYQSFKQSWLAIQRLYSRWFLGYSWCHWVMPLTVTRRYFVLMLPSSNKLRLNNDVVFLNSIKYLKLVEIKFKLIIYWSLDIFLWYLSIFINTFYRITRYPRFICSNTVWV